MISTRAGMSASLESQYLQPRGATVIVWFHSCSTAAKRSRY